MQEGPHSALNEEEFFDALEMAYQNDEIEPTVVSDHTSTHFHCSHVMCFI